MSLLPFLKIDAVSGNEGPQFRIDIDKFLSIILDYIARNLLTSILS